jgi:hypothetical protein
MVLGGFPGVNSASFGFIGLCDLGNDLSLSHNCGTQVPGSAFDPKDERVFQGLRSPSSPFPLLAVTAFDNTGENLYTFAFLTFRRESFKLSLRTSKMPKLFYAFFHGLKRDQVFFELFRKFF